jgi:hypothetical protein
MAPHLPVWHNQDLLLYHGTLDTHVVSINAGINLGLGRVRADFGQGFYTTTVEGQARSWARKMLQRSLLMPRPRPAVIRFTVRRDDLAGPASLWFVRGVQRAVDYWSLVAHCRTGGAAHGRAANPGWYDIVIGPVAGARWRRRVIIPNSDQVSFHTAGAVQILNAANKQTTVLSAGSWRITP